MEGKARDPVRVDDPGRAGRVHPARCLRLLLRRSGLIGPLPHPRRQAPATPAARQAGIVRDFKQAWEARDIDALIELLDPGVTVTADGGGLVSAALRPIEGGKQIALHGRYRQQGT
jgi:hypothetical protein